ncbi:MAG TPA: ABC transporter permease [Bosea sp. (in: a-proteobacteria)]|jgi:peptide/nickel transport system permease protein|uniref:ABC transporter permease n=1 Tax=Bosea sp. (in: a-proteobacteria) TaxID=1871050 RepID=UPI002DDD2DEF|nr:ABC transporter permease [Bosea sp. (in: a-proteobacteria)]HEV2556086.1 ABC transporter permease [Bosea sp. (in: a-proteobacteria)]
MAAYITRRLALVVLVLVAVSMLVFGVTTLLPANVAYLILGAFATPEQVHALELKLGLTDPVWQQYLRWAGGFVTGDLGVSTLMNRPVGPMLLEALQRSLMLTGLSFVLIAVIGVGLGIVAALRHGRPLDHGVSVATYLGIAVPEFFWAIVVIIVFAAWLGWLPASGYEPLSAGVWEWAKHLIAPTMTLVFGHLAHVSRLTRSSMIEVMQSPYITAARAKGLPERVIVLHHALRNALLPTITVLALDFGRLMGGIVVIETVFAYPGLGRLVVFSIQNRDLPTLQAAILVVAAIYALANLLADLLYARLNPKIRFGRHVA